MGWNAPSQSRSAWQQLSLVFYSLLQESVNHTTHRKQLQWFCGAAHVQRILNQQKVKVAYKPQQTINSLFPRPKELDDSDHQKSGIVYKLSCTQCNFVYYGQTERSLKTRIVEHKKAVASFDQNSKVAGHVHLFGHRMNFENVEVVGFESNYHERLFLEAWHSTLDPNSGNDHILLLEVYKGFARAWITWSGALASRHVTFTCVWQRTLLSFTDESLSINRNFCYQLLRVSGKPFP